MSGRMPQSEGIEILKILTTASFLRHYQKESPTQWHPMDDDNNIFDDDDALDCIIFTENEKPDRGPGCLSAVILLILIPGGLYCIQSWLS